MSQLALNFGKNAVVAGSLGGEPAPSSAPAGARPVAGTVSACWGYAAKTGNACTAAPVEGEDYCAGHLRSVTKGL